MSCLSLTPSAADQLNQLGGLTELFNSVVTGITTAGNWVVTNEKAITNVMGAAGALRNQGAATARNVSNAARLNLQGKAVPVGMTPAEWEAMQRAGATGDPMPTWLLPAGLGLGALVLVMVLMKRS